MQHLGADTEGPKLPQEAKFVLSLLVDNLGVAFHVQSVVQVDTQVSVVLHHLHLFAQDGDSCNL